MVSPPHPLLARPSPGSSGDIVGGRLHHPASKASPPEGPTTAGHRSATWISSPTSPRLRSCRSGRPARRPVQSLTLYGWFCHTRMRALVEPFLCSIQGPSMSARTFDRPTTHPTSEKVRRLVMPAEASSAVPSQEAGATRLRRGPCLDRAPDGCPPVAHIAARDLHPPADIAAGGHRGVQGCRAWEPTCSPATLAGDRCLGRDHQHASCCRRPTGHPAADVEGTTLRGRLAFDQGMRGVSRELSSAHGADEAPVAQDRGRCRHRWARAGAAILRGWKVRGQPLPEGRFPIQPTSRG